jgi:uncharacterized protein (TIGR03067 family)
MALTATAFLQVVAIANDDPHAADLAKMQGDWMVATMKAGGMDVPAEEAQSLFRSVEGDRYKIARYSKMIGQGTFKLDATQSPKAIDSQSDAPPNSPPILGIYEFDGDKLRVCNARPGQPRPKNFEAKNLTGHTTTVWEREK